MKYYRVAANTPFNDSILTYKSDQDHDKGDIVIVPLGKREVSGLVIERVEGLPGEIDPKKIKKILQKSESYSYQISGVDYSTYEWMAKYYHYPMGKLIFETIPKALKRPRALNEIKGRGETFGFNLSKDQSRVVEAIKSKIEKGFSKHLIHGVTGSGKTIIYLNLINELIASGKSVLFLLPEINLTPQFLKTFEKHASCSIYMYHSNISNSDRFGLWNLLNENDDPKIIIGVRSSIFLPIKNLGAIVVDEEHDNSFKQDDRCTYNARDVAIKKCQLLKIPFIAGSATPSLETYINFKEKENYYALKKRPTLSKLPKVEFVDMRDDKSKNEADMWPLHSVSVDKIKEALEKREQVLIFINKLGYASFMQCRGCGHQFECPNCHVNLRVHKQRHEISCHVCDYKDHLPSSCPVCGNMSLLNKGFGTEKVKEVAQLLFPQANVERFDRDEITTMSKLEDRLDRFHRGDIDILVGTQMMSKGHNFERVNLVVMLGIDSQLNFPDFRSNERVFQSLYQVSGRSGRFGRDGKVIVQTLAPDNKIYDYIKRQDFDTFYQDEIIIREICDCPPCTRIAMVYLTANSKTKIVDFASKYKLLATNLIEKHFMDVEILGPRPGFIEKRVNKFTWASMIKTKNVNQLHNFIDSLKRNITTKSGTSIKIDVDPLFIE